MGRFHSLQIKDIKKETKNTVSISLNVPSDLTTEFSFIAGQYLTFRLTLNGEEVRRSYSICSSPNSNELRVAVKQIENGLFSTYANNNLKVGDYIDVSIPEGKFTLETSPSDKKSYIAFAAGSGITPVISMIKDVLSNEPNSTFVLLYGNKTPDDTIFYNELNDLKTKHFGRFSLYYTFSQANESEALFGRIDTEKINYVLKNKHKGVNFDNFYLCGPETMIELTSAHLLSNGYLKNQIHFELFTASVKEAIPTSDATEFNGTAQVTVLVDDEETVITVKENETILDAALKSGVDAPYSCQGGVCSTCICLVTEGSVHMRKNSILTDSEIEEGLTLACQSIPKSATIAVDFDDV